MSMRPIDRDHEVQSQAREPVGSLLSVKGDLITSSDGLFLKRKK